MPGVVPVPPGPARPAGAYREHAPPAALASHVECFWSRGAIAAPSEATRAPRSHRVMPDGCVDIVVAFDPRSASAVAVGAMTLPLVVHDTSSTSYLGVRFRPGVAGVLFGLRASELTDERTALADVWPGADALAETLALAGGTPGRIRALSAAIARRLLSAPPSPPVMVAAAVERLTTARGSVAIRTLAAELGVTRQHLARSFAHHVGLSPKMLARIIRARGVVARVRGATDVDWTSVALEAGYYDQSHLIAEVKQLTGLSPSTWLNGQT